jgi:hypothetical protein
VVGRGRLHERQGLADGLRAVSARLCGLSGHVSHFCHSNINFSAQYYPGNQGGGGSLAVYGWTTNPLIEVRPNQG